MPVLVLKTSLETHAAVNWIRPVLDLHPAINRWHVDTEDIDNVLRVEASDTLTEPDLSLLLGHYQINCTSFT